MTLRTELPFSGGSKPATSMQALLHWSLIILGLVVLLFVQSARADVALRVQAQPIADPIQAFVTVTDANGVPVSNLTAANFTMLVDGVAVTAPAVSQPPSQDPSQHVSVIFAMDYSPSVVDTHVAVMRQAVIDFINTMEVGDYAAIVKFNVTNPNGASVVLPFTRIDGATGTQALIAAVNADYPGRESNIFDGVTVSVAHFATPPAPLPVGPKAIILITDGDENNSSAEINTAIAAAVDAGTPIFTVGIGDFTSATSQQVLNALPDGTGGTFYPAPTDADVCPGVCRSRAVAQQRIRHHVYAQSQHHRLRDTQARGPGDGSGGGYRRLHALRDDTGAGPARHDHRRSDGGPDQCRSRGRHGHRAEQHQSNW